MPNSRETVFQHRLRKFFILLLFIGFHSFANAQIEPISSTITRQTFIYAIKDTNHLGLDVYTQKGADSNVKKPCIVFVFGGAFIAGRRDDSIYNNYFNNLVEHNYVVVSISYRLGLWGVKHVSKYNIKPLKNAIEMAVEDVYDATNWVISNAGAFGIDTGTIVLSGSSSGAITVLESEYDGRNASAASNKLPEHFKYAGVMAFSGAILSFDWGLKFKTPPAPILMFHGTADHIVPYNKVGFLNKGFYGSAWIAKICRKNNYPYYLYSEVGLGHEVSVLPMIYNLPLILDFMDKYVVQRKPYQTDLTFKDPNAKPMMLQTPEELFKKLQTKPQ